MWHLDAEDDPGIEGWSRHGPCVSGEIHLLRGIGETHRLPGGLGGAVSAPLDSALGLRSRLPETGA